MQITNKKFFKTSQLIIVSALLFFILAACDKKNDTQPSVASQPPAATQPKADPKADLASAQLKDFPLFEVSYLDIKITHPEVVADEEKKQGEIEITIPYTQYTKSSMMLSLKKFDLDFEKFYISPSIGDQQDFSKGAVTYSIFSNFFKDKAVHYKVKIVYGGEPFNENAKITGFKFEKDKNPSLPTTIEALKIVDYENSEKSAIYIIVPAGTDYSNLTPTISYDAARLSYNVSGEFKAYPPNGMVIDFKYPKSFSLQAENSLGVKSKTYSVIVDVKDPLKFVEPFIITPDCKKGEKTTHLFESAGSWVNQGNHPITGLIIKNYKDKIYPFTGYTGDIITAYIRNPNMLHGVLPGESGSIDVTFRAATFGDFDGVYKTTAEITPTFDFSMNEISYWPVKDRIEGIFETKSFTIQTTIK